jgi:hypothetical protein
VKEVAPGSGTAGAGDVEALSAKLGLAEDDLDDVVFEEEGKQPDATRWLAVGKVHTETEFSHYCFFKNMRSAWDLAKDVKIKVIEENMFVFQFACLGDWEKVWKEAHGFSGEIQCSWLLMMALLNPRRSS